MKVEQHNRVVITLESNDEIEGVFYALYPTNVDDPTQLDHARRLDSMLSPIVNRIIEARRVAQDGK